MERNYPSSSFSDPLTPSAQSAAWAYERAGLKPSLSYGAGHAEAELLHRQAYTAAQLPAYSATHHPAGLAGLFDTSLHGAGINTTETSVMNFLSAMESRTAASSGATLLPQFRASSWQTGMHSSADLFVTGALPTSGTFPPTSALSAYQHPSSFSSRNFVSTPSLSLQDGTFNASSNGILTHDPLLQLKTSPCAIPTALTFDRLSSSVLASSLPIQSSTYRSAQESAPHLLQPQFSLLPSALAGAQQASQAYSTAVFAGSPASIERALQRECSVIKHHQRPSSSQSVQAQLAGSHHSLQTYLPSVGGINFHDTRQSTLSCSPLVDITQVSNGGLPKTSRVTVELAQSYTSAIPSSGYPLSSVKGKNCSTKLPPISTKTSKPQNVVLPVQTQSYNKSAQSSVIASQAQIYSSAQLPNLLAVSQSQTFVSTQSPNMSTVSDSQAFSPLKSEKLPLLYKSINTFSNPSQAITSDSQTYSVGQQHSLPLSSNESYSDQVRNISSTPSQSYTSNQPQSLSPASQSPVNYTSQSHRLSVSPSVSYTSRHLTSPAPSLPFSSSSGAQNISGSSPTPNYNAIVSSQNSQSQDSTLPQSQTFSPATKSPFASPTSSHALQNNRLSTDAKSYVSKRKLQSSVYSPAKQDTDFAMQDLQVLQHQASLESSTQRLTGGGMNDQESAYRILKTDDRYHSPSVIRSSSRLDQGVFVPHRSKIDEQLVSSVSQLSQQIDHIDSMASHDLKHSANLMQTSHEQVRAEELNLQNPIRKKVHETKDEGHPSRGTCSSSQAQTSTLSHAQTVSDSSCDLHMLQPSFLQSDYRQTKSSTHVLQSHNSQNITPPFLQLDSHIITNSGGQQHPHQQSSETLKRNITCPPKVLQSQQLTTKDNFRQPDQRDSKNQFFPLGSICFPESMLLPDGRNILSNVDDILAATAAACGMSTQGFTKVSSSEGTQSVENIDESKANFQLGVRHVSPSFTPSQAPVSPQERATAVLPNSGQMQQNLSPLDTAQSNVTCEGEIIDLSDQKVPSRMDSPTFKPVQEEEDPITVPRGQCTNNQNIQEDNDAEEGSYNNIVANPELSSNTNCLGEETAVSDDDISMCVDNENVGSDEANVFTPVNSETQPCANSLNVSESENQDTTQGSLHTDQEMENNSKSPVSEDENANMKWQNNDKRLISKGIDLSLPCSPSDIAESYFDSSQHQERIRQKIKEVEEQQPEVKCGFIGSFLDFLKGDPKIPTSKAPNRTKRPAAILRAPFLQHVPFKNLPLMNPLSPQENVVSKTEQEVDDGLKKNLQALPSFSSEEDCGGGRDLQKSLSTALSALDHAAENVKKSESTKSAMVTVTPVVKKEPFCISSPAVKVEENPKAIEPPKLPSIDSSLARKQDTVAFLGLTDDEQSDSGGEGTFRERDEFVVKIDDIEALQLCLSTGEDPPAIWRVQKALLQKFVPELRYGIRQYSATNSYLGYFGDTKTKYKRVYAKFIENANKKEYVRLCSRKPKPKPAQPARTGHTKVTGGSKASESLAPKVIATKGASVKSKVKQPKVKAEPPPKKRKTWKGEFPSPSDTPPEVKTEEDGSVCDFLHSPNTSTRCVTVQTVPIVMDVDPPPVPKEPLSVASKSPPPALIEPPLTVIQPIPALIQAPNISKQPPSTQEKPPAALKPAPPKRAPAKRAPAKRAPAKRTPSKLVPPPPKQAPLRPVTEMQPELSLSEKLLPQLPLTEKPQSPTAEKQLPQSLPIEEPLPQSPPPNDSASQLPSLDKKQPQSPHVEEQLPQSPPAEKPPPQTPPADKQPPLTPKKTPTMPKQCVTTPDTPPIPFASRSLRTRAMKETFRSYMELLVSVALDADTMQALEKGNDELLLPHMRKFEGMINEGCSKVLDKLNLTQSHKNALETFPELTILTRENKSKKGGPPISKIKVNGKAYNKKTLRNTKSNKSSQEFTVDPARTQLCSLYHSLHHYRYHVYLICKDEIAAVVKANADLGQEQIVQLCMKNMTWVETLFERFGELLSEVQEKCG